MLEEWIVRVQEREFGPANFATLREWREDGRLLAQNPVRKSDGQDWITAGEIPDLFDVPESPSADEGIVRPGKMVTFSQIIVTTCRIYGRGFRQFFALSLLIGIPSLALQTSLAFVDFSEKNAPVVKTPLASAAAVVALVITLVSWPIFIAGLQLISGEVLAGRTISLREVLRRAIQFWPRTARLSALVYGSFVFWTFIPFVTILSLVSGGDVSLFALALAILILGLQVYMTARLFVNFMFWQQSAVLANREGVNALIESRELARSQPTAPRLQRPLYRGAIVASLWLLLLLALSAGVELPFLLFRMRGVTTVEQASALVQTFLSATTPDSITLVTYVVSMLVHALLRPLLGIAFVVLYFDAKAGLPAGSAQD
ncbi:MAG: DUF4339 domain-containing protein [Chthoniobacterales bacterium]